MTEFDYSIIPEDGILVVKVDIGNLPAHKASEYLQSIKDDFKNKNPDRKVIVSPNTNTFEIIPEPLTENSKIIVRVHNYDKTNVKEIIENLEKILSPAQVVVLPEEFSIELENK